MKFCVLGVGEGLGAILGSGIVVAIQASLAWVGWGLERGWGEVVEGEGGILGRGM